MITVTVLQLKISDNIKPKLILWWKSDSQLPKDFALFTFIENPLKMMKNAFYFILKALFLPKILKVLSWIFGNVEKTNRLERQD